LLLTSGAFSQPPPDAAVMQRLQALSKQAQTCGMDLGCLARVQKEMEALTQELMQSAPVTPGARPGTSTEEMKQQRARGQRAAEAASKALASRQEEVCYAVLYQKRVAYESHGSDLPWLSCTPLEIRVRWRISEIDSLSGFDGRYEVTQTYPAYLQIERAQHERLRVLGYSIVGPAPQGRVSPDSALSSGSATLTGVKYHGILAPRPYDQKTFGTGNTADFSIAPDHGSLEFQHELSRPRGDRLIAHHLRIWGPRVSVSIRSRQANLAHTFFQPEVDEFGEPAFTREEIAQGLRTGRLEKRFAVKLAQAQMRLSGSAEVTILFDHEPGRLRVTPVTAIDASGPDCGLAFQPARTRYTLDNPGDAPIAYRIDGATPWARLSRSAGTLQAGRSTSVTVEVDGTSFIAKPGTRRTTLKFTNSSNGLGNTQRAVTLTVRPTQEWQVTLDGHFSRRLWTEREILPPGASSSKLIKDTRSYRFDYHLAAKAMIEKRKGKWHYACGRVTASDVSYGYGHTPSNLWNVTKKACVNCVKIRQLKGKALGGQVYGSSLQLLWDDIRPGLEVTADLGVKCWEHKKVKKSCGYSQKGGTAYYGDDLFVHNARDHLLPLKSGPYTPKKLEKSAPSYWQEVVFSYGIKQLR
jgi:hypothetical protein